MTVRSGLSYCRYSFLGSPLESHASYSRSIRSSFTPVPSLTSGLLLSACRSPCPSLIPPTPLILRADRVARREVDGGRKVRGEQRETEPTFPATIHPSSSCLSSCLYSSPSIHRSPTGPAGAEWMEVVRRVTRDTSDERYAPRFICYLRPFCHSTSLRSSFVSSACHSLCSLHSSSPTGRAERVEWKDEGVTRHQAKRDPEGMSDRSE